MKTKLALLISDMLKKGTFCTIKCYVGLYVNCKKKKKNNKKKNPIAQFIHMCTVINI